MTQKSFPDRTPGVDDLGVCPDCGREYVNINNWHALCLSCLDTKQVPRFSFAERIQLREERWLATWPEAHCASKTIRKKRFRFWRIDGVEGVFVATGSHHKPIDEPCVAKPPEVIAVAVRPMSFLLRRFTPVED